MPCNCSQVESKRSTGSKLLSRNNIANIIDGLTLAELNAINYDWRLWARPQQLPPSCDWSTWLVMAGRGFGKTRTGAEWVTKKARENAGCRIAMIAPTAGDARDTMCEGVSGVMSISSPSFMPEYEPSKRRITWPNGSIATVFSAEKPDRLRGPNHHFAWCDELCFWEHVDETWDMLQFGLRLGESPQTLVTTTPRPIGLLKNIIAQNDTHKTTGSTFDNSANLAPKYIQNMRARYEGSTLGRQELYAELLGDVAGALFKREQIDATRVAEAPALRRVVIAVDPSASSNSKSDEAGVIVCGVDNNKNYYVINDGSGTMAPNEWATRALELYREYKADSIVCEGNLARGMVVDIFNNMSNADDIPIRLVNATRSKHARAEPVSVLHEQGRLHHVGHHPRLEDQLCSWVAGETKKSPDRLDAMVWGISSLMQGAAIDAIAPISFGVTGGAFSGGF